MPAKTQNRIIEAQMYRYEHKHFKLENQPMLTLDDLRNLIRGKTWEDMCEHSINITPIGGVLFTARMGAFLRRKVIAACAQDQIVAMRFVQGPTLRPNFYFESPIDGTQYSGFVLLHGDFMSGRLGDIKLTDLVIGDDDA